MIKARLINLGARIPADLKKKISDYCDRNGIKLQFFITEAILEKLAEIEQGKIDNKMQNLLIEGYQKVADEDKEVSKDWDSTVNDGIK